MVVGAVLIGAVAAGACSSDDDASGGSGSAPANTAPAGTAPAGPSTDLIPTEFRGVEVVVVDDPWLDDQLSVEIASLLDEDRLVYGTAAPEVDDQVVGESVQWVVYDVDDADDILADVLVREAEEIDEAAAMLEVDGTTYWYFQLEGDANLQDAAVAIGSPIEGLVLVVSVGGVADGDVARSLVEEALQAVPTA